MSGTRSKFNTNLLDHSAAVSLWQVWQKTAQACPDTLALHDPHAKPEVKLSYREVVDQIAMFGAGLRSIGIQFGDKVSLIADNSPRWLIADQGILAIGAANATRSSQAERTELLYIIEHSDSIALVVEDIVTLKKLQPDVQSLPLKTIILLSDETPPEGAYNFKQILERGSDSHGDAYRRDLGNPPIDRNTLATLIYTSGTTGKPKGVMLTHGNLLTQVEGGKDMVQPFPGEVALSILPTWHSYERAGEYYLLSQGMTQIYTNLRSIKADLVKYKPHFMLAVPRLWESVYEGISKKFAAESPFKQALIKFLLAGSQNYIKARRIKNDLSLEAGSKLVATLRAAVLSPVYWLAQKILFEKIREAVGGRVKYLTSGGGSLQPHIDLFYEMAGIEIINGYGLTETSPMLTARRPHRNLRGTAGVPLRNTEIQIVDLDSRIPLEQGKIGLVMARGPQIMQGYYKNPEATAKAIDPDGWFDTGDLGWLTANNDLILTGRAKDTIVLTNGENIEPQAIEDACTRSPYIDQIVLVGQDRKQLGALIVANLTPLEAANIIPPGAQLRDVLEILASDKVQAIYREELNREVKSRPGYTINDRIGPFAFLPEPITIENGLMTQTFKIRRNVVTDRRVFRFLCKLSPEVRIYAVSEARYTKFRSHPPIATEILLTRCLSKSYLDNMGSIDFANQLLVKRAVNVKVIVTPRWKDEMQQQLQFQISQADGQVQQLDMQGQRAISEIERQSIKPPGPDVAREIESIRLEVNRRKSEVLEQKNQLLQQLNQVQVLELEQEVNQGQLDSFFPVGKGDNLIALMQVEVVLRDGVIEDIRAGFPAEAN